MSVERIPLDDFAKHFSTAIGACGVVTADPAIMLANVAQNSPAWPWAARSAQYLTSSSPKPIIYFWSR